MTKGKVALGKGLGALLPGGDETRPDPMPADVPATRLYDFQDRARVGRVSDIEIDQIDPNPFQPRQSFDEGALEELAASIRQLGVIQPITVRAVEHGRFQIISGERRVRAARRAGLRAVPSYVREADTEAMLEMALVENVQREELNPIEVAVGYQRLIDECRLKQEEVADRVGKNRTTVTNFLRLLRLPPPVQACLRDGSLSVGHARALIPVEDEKAQLQMLAKIVDGGLSVRAVEDLVKAWHRRRDRAERDVTAPEPPQPIRSTRDTLQLRALTDRLRSSLGTRVQIRPGPSGEGGRIEVAYYSDDDLERLIDLMGS
jgi:ParB family chromosome partitioning protein